MATSGLLCFCVGPLVIMFYALVHYPHIDTSSIDQLRSRYDPQFDLIGPHITVVFPVPSSIGKERLSSHVSRVLRMWDPFEIRLNGLSRSPDDYLFLLVADGSEIISRLHDELYSGILAEHRREDIPFVPHVTLGACPNATDLRNSFFIDAERMELDYRSYFDRLSLVTIDYDRSRIIESTEYLLGAFAYTK